MLIADLNQPKVEEIKLDEIENKLRTIKRFGGQPKALTVWQHTMLVCKLIEGESVEELDPLGNYKADLITYAHFHDYHEGITGDIIGPIKTFLYQHTDALHRLEMALDHAIHMAANVGTPSPMARSLVHRYDKAAETLEWVFALGEEPEEWNAPTRARWMMQGPSLIEWARSQ
jgi:5'-deoxynucleotidase YfbR-like HD superfamily hydrolase